MIKRLRNSISPIPQDYFKMEKIFTILIIVILLFLGLVFINGIFDGISKAFSTIPTWLIYVGAFGATILYAIHYERKNKQ